MPVPSVSNLTAGLDYQLIPPPAAGNMALFIAIHHYRIGTDSVGLGDRKLLIGLN